MIDFVASRPHYAAHLRPVYDALPRWARGVFGGEGGHVVVVASAADYARARRAYRHVVLMEHGIGQSYAGDPRSADHPSYAGGRGYGTDLAGILAPNAFSAARWKRAYPTVPVIVVGATYDLPAPGGPPTLGLAFHWDSSVCREAGSAWRHYRRGLLRLAEEVPLVVHSHPRAPERAKRMRRMGLEVIDDLFELARRATVFAVDNSSTLYEMAVSRPVIAMDAPWYRRDVYHGLRFWDLIPGPRVADIDELVETARALLRSEPAASRTGREMTVEAVIPYRDGADRAARWLLDWLDAA